jgi:tetratricopeptide (TPR) repeat protein
VLAAFALLGPAGIECQTPSAQALDEQAGKALDAGNVDQAIEFYRKLLQLTPDAIEARTNLGVALGREGHYDEAAQQYRQVLSHDPSYQPALLNLALALYKQAEFAAWHCTNQPAGNLSSGRLRHAAGKISRGHRTDRAAIPGAS